MTLELKIQQERRAHIPKTGELMTVPPKYVLRLKPSSNFKSTVAEVPVDTDELKIAEEKL